MCSRGRTTCGQARELRTIPVPPQAGAPTQQSFPIPRAGLATTPLAWPQKLAVSPDGARLLVPLNLADAAAIVDLAAAGAGQAAARTDRVRYVAAGSYPFGAAIAPGGRIGLVSNEAAGTVSVVDLRRGVKVTRHHGRRAAVAPAGHRHRQGRPAGVRRAVGQRPGRRHRPAQAQSSSAPSGWVGTAGLGTMPTAVALSPAGDRLFVAESGADELAGDRAARHDDAARHRVDAGRTHPHRLAAAGSGDGGRAGRTARAAAVRARPRGSASGRTPTGRTRRWRATRSSGPSTRLTPTFDVFARVGYTAKLVRGQAGLMTLPTDAQVDGDDVRRRRPADARPTPRRRPADTVLRANGPIKHVFFIVRENRSYDQLLGDDPRGNGDPEADGVRQGRDAQPARAGAADSRCWTTCMRTQRPRSRGTSGPSRPWCPTTSRATGCSSTRGAAGPTTSAPTR